MMQEMEALWFCSASASQLVNSANNFEICFHFQNEIFVLL